MKYRAGGVVVLLAAVLSGCTTVEYISAPRAAADAEVCRMCDGTGKLQVCPQCRGDTSTVEMREIDDTHLLGRGHRTSLAPVSELQRKGPSCTMCSGRGMIPDTGGSRVCSRCAGTGRVYPVDSKGDRIRSR